MLAARAKAMGRSILIPNQDYYNIQYWISKSQTVLKVTLLTFIKILTYCQCPDIIILMFVSLLAKMNLKE